MQEIISSDANLEKEIQVLETRLAEKKAEFNQSDTGKEALRLVVRERMTERFEPKISKAPVSQTKNDQKITPIIPSGKVSVGKLKLTPKQEQLQVLVGVALAQSIPEAVDLAEKLESPYLMDELHDVLVDKFYEVLIKRGKI